jgi:cardiolipin synthase
MRVIGWAFAIWGSALYWCAALLYAEQARRLLGADRADRAMRPGSTGSAAVRTDSGDPSAD